MSMLLIRLETFYGYLESGGFVMGPLAVGAVLLWYALGYRIFTLRRGTGKSISRLVESHMKEVRGNPTGIIDSAVAQGVKVMKRGCAPLRPYLDERYSDYEKEMNRYSVLVNSIVVVSPLAGLLGTVTGMIETFQALGEMSLFSQSGGIAGGISQALISTQMGLAVAIPGLVVGRVLVRRQRNLSCELEKLKDYLCNYAMNPETKQG
jgi:biopolymer transport protein ExbB